MTILQIQNVCRDFGAQRVLANVSFEIAEGEKVGLIGANGSGKTTLLRVLLGLDKPTSGAARMADDIRLGYVPQHVEFHKDETVSDYLLAEYREARAELREREEQLVKGGRAAMEKALRAYQRARDAHDRIDGDHYESRAARMLDAFGLKGKERQTITDLSGGEQNVLAMAKALLARPDFLVLDEPANHLDYLGVAWLEDFLRKFKGAVLMVSHNRYLLDRVVGAVLDLTNTAVKRYPGNYSAYRAIKLREEIRHQAEFETYQKRLTKLETLVQRMADIARVHSDKSWGRRLRSRRSQLERTKTKEAVDRPDSGPRKAAIRFSGEATRANVVLKLNGYTKRYGEKTLLENVRVEITSGERVALIGPNGCGKTSLLRDIIEHGNWDNQTIRVGPSIVIGYCAQQQEVLNPKRTIFEEITAAGAGTRNQAHSVLARFLFYEDDLAKRVRDLSGGERNRLQLARLMVMKPNFLILDEPTNHLDIQTREAVEEALDEYEGTLLVVSHDRYFLEKTARRVLEVSDRELVSYPGSYTEFWLTRTEREVEQKQKPGGKTARKKREKPKRLPASPAGRAKDRALAKLERDIEELEREKNEREGRAAAAFSRGDHAEGTRISLEAREIQSRMDALYAEWMSG